MKDKKQREREKFREKLDEDEVMAFTWKYGKYLPTNLWCESR